MARKLYENDGRNKVSKMAVASHLGHDSLRGPALGKIGALRAYGLIEGAGDESRVTEDAITALLSWTIGFLRGNKSPNGEDKGKAK